ncbi:MAG: deoxyguanosinetriphosphate triphosphohydrolase [Candidatus Actinomarina sp.]|jgi:dGTPase|uniref:MedDCM-OCT-S45-C3-cds38 n=1 Tax=Candidatus Actinomarina minuta TaxID=1389454 RepID=S5DQU5_9ACTN|nr:MedDCM-OCT-S45-C3-cds38 [Candidatus Actinomarina minuta]MDC3227125.1 deoxyguanosinetriphosphate triphosphohydrolase [Acidimicrobiaceae bacterium]|tara:strand:- start:1606 stop:2586 length:981 start_codon:yes stop_codon:yes gene_type:complete
MNDSFILRDRKWRETNERITLSSNAMLSENSKGRLSHEEHDEFRTIFERDRDRIIHSKAFRRLKHKTQVFINPDGDHFITRMTHTLNVTQVGRSISKTLGLNPDLTEAICLGHDVGHSPFGHTGEEILNEMHPNGWSHSENSVKIFSKIENLNLSVETIDGIEKHPWRYTEKPSTQEGMICRFADRIAYLSHDVEDALRANVIKISDIPNKITKELGTPGKQWINSLISGIFKASNSNELIMDSEIGEIMNELREFMFENVYLRKETNDQRKECKNIVQTLVEYFMENKNELPKNYIQSEDDIENSIDYVAGMTDRFAISTFGKIN